MKLSTPLTKKRMIDHLAYHFWKYLLAAVLSVFVWNMVFLQTEYRPPQEKRIDIYLQAAGVSAEDADAFFHPVWQSAVPDMETVQTVVLMPSGQDSYLGDMQLTTYLMAGEGDLYILSRADFKKFASQGAFIPLEGLAQSGALDLSGLDAKAGWIASQTAEEADGQTAAATRQHLYGIPMKGLERFERALGLNADDLLVGITVLSGNEDNAVKFLSGLLDWSRSE